MFSGHESIGKQQTQEATHRIKKMATLLDQKKNT